MFDKLGKVKITKEGEIFLTKTVKDEIDSNILGDFKEGEEQIIKLQISV